MSGVHIASIRANAYAAGAKPLDSGFFGGNFLSDRDRADQGGGFDAKINALGIEFLRYPGGTITEDFFRLSDPDRAATPAGARTALKPLSDFTAYAAAKDADYSLVIPINNYARSVAAREMSLAAATAELRGFLTLLKAGAYGDHMPAVMELGNEFYAETGMSEVALARAYGPVARAFAAEIRAVFGAEVDIAAQAGQSRAANNIVISQFSGAPGLVDAVIIHAYPWTLDQVDSHLAQKTAIANAWAAAGLADDIFLSEWNMSNQYMSGGRVLGGADIGRGLAQSASMVELLAGFAKAGVGRATVWPIQQNTPGDLAGDVGETGANAGKLSARNLTLAGEVFAMMSSELKGLTALETSNIDIDGASEAARYRDEFLIEAFGGGQKLVVFVSAWDLKAHQQDTGVRLDIEGRFSGAEVTTLRAAGPNPLDPNAGALVSTTAHGAVRSASDLTFRFTDPYEIKMVVFDKAPAAAAQTPQAGSGPIVDGRGDDRLHGGPADDVLRGGRGDDRLFGRNGDDRLHGGPGEDILSGGRGADILRGLHGDDRLVGRRGADALFGGAGDDVLFGGCGDDTMTGGAGRDTFIFRAHEARDVITDFQDGFDRIALRGALDFDDLRFIDRGGDTLIRLDGGAILLEGVDRAELSPDDFLF